MAKAVSWQPLEYFETSCSQQFTLKLQNRSLWHDTGASFQARSKPLLQCLDYGVELTSVCVTEAYER